jgi:hypothetical protein
VRALRKTYLYLEQLKPAERRTTLNRFILHKLPSVEREARTDQAPGFCDEPGIGLPEPDPRIPQRPKGLRERG